MKGASRLVVAPPHRRWRGALHPPRRWQVEALPLALEALASGRGGLIHAATGSGKSALIAEVCACIEPAPGAVLLISTPTQALVEQLASTVAARLGEERAVGRWFAGERRLGRVTVTCNPSLPSLAEALEDAGLRASAWIVDEAHGSECATLLAAAEALGPQVPRLGLTATPFRARASEALSLFGELLYTYDAEDARRDGVIVPFVVRPWEGEEVPLDDACAEMIREAIEDGWTPLVVDASDIQDAEAFASRLREREGVRAEAVHSGQGRAQVEGAIQRLIQGRLDALVHVALLKEGVNIPALRALCLRREVKSPVWMVQHIGRVLRAAPGKDRALILDPGGQLWRVGLHRAPRLAGEEGDEVEEVEESGLLGLWEEEHQDGIEEDDLDLDEAPRSPRLAAPVPPAATEALSEALRLEQAGQLARTPIPPRCLDDDAAAWAWKARMWRELHDAPGATRWKALQPALRAWEEADVFVATLLRDAAWARA